MGIYRIGLACLNGHAVNDSFDSRPQHNAKFCPDCGEPTIHRCPTCNTPLRGDYYVEAVIGGSHWHPATHCFECGSPFPWTNRRSEALADALNELEELSGAERQLLVRSIPDILVQTPKSETAALRYKKAITKIGGVGAKILADVLRKVAADTVKSSLGL